MPPSAGMSFPPLKPGCAVDEDRIPISRLTQAGYCLRRAALLENEQIWIESADTAKGRMEHERVHTARVEKRSDCIQLSISTAKSAPKRNMKSSFVRKQFAWKKCFIPASRKEHCSIFLPTEGFRFYLRRNCAAG